jgi:hypothetical protein
VPDYVTPNQAGTVLTVRLNFGYRFGQPEDWSPSGFGGVVRQEYNRRGRR